MATMRSDSIVAINEILNNVDNLKRTETDSLIMTSLNAVELHFYKILLRYDEL